jgi:hypothetical protein
MGFERTPFRYFFSGLLIATLAVGGAGGVGVAWAGEPTSADKETARSLMEQGHKAYDSGNYEEALRPFQSAHDLMHAPTTGLWLARTRDKLGKLIEARDVALEVARSAEKSTDPPAFAKARAEAATLAKELAPRLATLEITVVGPAADEVQLTIDEEPIERGGVGVPRKINPGNHGIRATAQGYSPANKSVSLSEGATESVTLTLEKNADGSGPKKPVDDPKDAGSNRTLAYVGFGVGGVGLLVGAISGGVALSNASSAKDFCQDTRCRVEAGHYIDTSNAFADVSTVAFSVGVAGVALGVIGLFTAGPDKPASGPKSAAWTRALPKIDASLTKSGSSVSLSGRW